MGVPEVIKRFVLTSAVMWAAPLAILWAFNANLLPSISALSEGNRTLLSGILAVVAVNAVIGFYIWMALKDPPTGSEPQPDPAFAARARASMPRGATVVEGDKEE